MMQQQTEIGRIARSGKDQGTARVRMMRIDEGKPHEHNRDFRALTRWREAEEPVETVAPAASFGSWDAEVRQEGPRAPSNQRLTLIALCFFRDQFQLAKFWTYASVETSFCPLCSCVMTLVNLALTKMLAVQIVGCVSGILTLPWDQRSGRHQQAGNAFKFPFHARLVGPISLLPRVL